MSEHVKAANVEPISGKNLLTTAEKRVIGRESGQNRLTARASLDENTSKRTVRISLTVLLVQRLA